jgi:hypothetical protein
MKSRTVLQFVAALTIAGVSFSTSSVQAESTESANAVAIGDILKPPGEFTWMEFGQSVAWGAITGGASGGVAGLVGLPAGVEAGYVAGYLGEAVLNGLNYLNGVTETAMPVPARALD